MIEIKRNDKQFNLDNVTNAKLFAGLKQGIVSTIQKVKGYEEVTSENIKLDERFSNRAEAFGGDKNLYPKIALSIEIAKYTSLYPAQFTLMVTPFDIKMLVAKNQIELIGNETLDKSLDKFMAITFPNSNYIDKKEEYKRKTALFNKIYNNLVFGEDGQEQ